LIEIIYSQNIIEIFMGFCLDKYSAINSIKSTSLNLSFTKRNQLIKKYTFIIKKIEII